MFKNLKNNKKGFTLIELLAVIVILAILVMIAIPAVTKYLDTARRGAFADSVNTAVDAVRGAYTSDFGSDNVPVDNIYEVEANINPLLTKKLGTSPFGGKYMGYIQVIDDTLTSDDDVKNLELGVCIKDEKDQGVKLILGSDEHPAGAVERKDVKKVSDNCSISTSK